ncbi:MAG: YfdX family protein [Bryobacteraceae bacterium]
MTVTIPALDAAPQDANTNKSAHSSSSNASGNTSEQLSRVSTQMLRQVDLARQAMGKKQTQAALQHVNEAASEQSRVASMAKAKGLPAVVPLYSELDESSVLKPLQAKKQGGQQSGASSSAPIGVAHTSGEYTFIGVDLDKAKQRLDAAKTALQNRNLQSADDSLAAVQTDLVMETVASDLPLLTARENLGLAKSAVGKKDYQEARTALKDACSALDRYATEASVQHVQDAKDLSKAISSYSQNIAQNHSGAANKIDGWWREVDNWFTKRAQS